MPYLMLFTFLLRSLQFHSTPLYLEWAPMGVFSGPAPQQKTTEASEKEGEASTAPGKRLNFGLGGVSGYSPAAFCLKHQC